MRAWYATRHGDFREVLVLRPDAPEPPAPGPEELLVRVEAIGLNYADTLAIAGHYQVRTPPPFVPGSEVAGTVVAAGSATPFAEGDRVVAFGVVGACAERVRIPADHAFRVPDGIPARDAAALLVTHLTAHLGLIRRGRLRAGERLLVHSGAGGVGTAAIQIGRQLGAHVLATAGSPAKLDLCRELGAEVAIDYRRDSFLEEALKATEGRGVEVVLDPVGGPAWRDTTRILAWEGRWIVVGFSGGEIPEIGANRIMLKNIDVVGLNLPGYLDGRRAVLEESLAELWSWYRTGSVVPVVYATLPLDELPAALALLRSRDSHGKIVVVP